MCFNTLQATLLENQTQLDESITLDKYVGQIAENLLELNNWCVEYLAQPHENLGRTGPVCPFVPTSINLHKLKLTYLLHDSSTTPQEIIESIKPLGNDFFKSFNNTKLRTYNSVIVSFINIDPKDSKTSAKLVENVQYSLKSEFIEKGGMIGEFFPNSPAPGIYNPEFAPFHFKNSALAIRYIKPQDLVFMTKSKEHLDSYLKVNKITPTADREDMYEKLYSLLKSAKFTNSTALKHLNLALDMISSDFINFSLPEFTQTDFIETLDYIHSNKYNMLGKPANLDFNLSETPIAQGLDVLLNNTGNPLSPSSHKLDTKRFEVSVLQHYKDIHKCPDPYFGYITTGGTEGLEYGLYYGFKYLRTFSGEKNIRAYLSTESHISAFNILEKLQIPHSIIPSMKNGSMDIEQFQMKLAADDKLISSSVPGSVTSTSIIPLVLANIGTTMKGATDDIPALNKIVSQRNGYIHADAALFGGFQPYIQFDPLKKHNSNNPHLNSHSETLPVYNFNFFNSMSISLHKFLGNPVPSGVVLVKQGKEDPPQIFQNAHTSYVNSPNSTLSCSRSGLASMIASYRLSTLSPLQLNEMAVRCLSLAEYLEQQLLQRGIDALRNPVSNIVYFPNPNKPESIQKYMLPLDHLDNTHIVVMPHVSKKLLDSFLSETFDS